MSDESDATTDSVTRVVPWPIWAVYLGISWTWCIGMYLPVLLLRDYTLASFFIFALPNVIGAAAMGFLLRDVESSRAMALKHRGAISTFSMVTILFQSFFVGWAGREMFGAPDVMAAGFAALFITMTALFRFRVAAAPVIATLVAVGSLFVLGCVATYRNQLGLTLPSGSDGYESELAGLAAVCVFGFALCPYLDATFHHARQQLSRRDARSAFATGFCFVFAAMITLTLLYADLIGVPRLRPFIASLLAGHIVVQTAFTAAAHTELGARSFSRVFVTFASAAVAFAIGVWADFPIQGFGSGEFLYRVIMSFYGLLAPAYVWLFVIPRRDPRDRAAWIVFATATVAASPFYWMAFIERKMVWASAGVAIVLVARLFVPGRRQLKAMSESSASA